MKDMLVYVEMPSYLREWLIYHYGNPIRFPHHSLEHLVLLRNLRKRPKNARPEMEGRGQAAVVIPDNDYKRPEFYNYLGKYGRWEFVSSVRSLFLIDLWCGCSHLLASRMEINRGIDSWCACNGISLDGREAVRQIFYRARKRYRDSGVALGKIYRRKSSAKNVENEHLT